MLMSLAVCVCVCVVPRLTVRMLDIEVTAWVAQQIVAVAESVRGVCVCVGVCQLVVYIKI